MLPCFQGIAGKQPFRLSTALCSRQQPRLNIRSGKREQHLQAYKRPELDEGVPDAVTASSSATKTASAAIPAALSSELVADLQSTQHEPSKLLNHAPTQPRAAGAAEAAVAGSVASVSATSEHQELDCDSTLAQYALSNLSATAGSDDVIPQYLSVSTIDSHLLSERCAPGTSTLDPSPVGHLPSSDETESSSNSSASIEDGDTPSIGISAAQNTSSVYAAQASSSTLLIHEPQDESRHGASIPDLGTISHLPPSDEQVPRSYSSLDPESEALAPSTSTAAAQNTRGTCENAEVPVQDPTPITHLASREESEPGNYSSLNTEIEASMPSASVSAARSTQDNHESSEVQAQGSTPIGHLPPSDEQEGHRSYSLKAGNEASDPSTSTGAAQSTPGTYETAGVPADDATHVNNLSPSDEYQPRDNHHTNTDTEASTSASTTAAQSTQGARTRRPPSRRFYTWPRPVGPAPKGDPPFLDAYRSQKKNVYNLNSFLGGKWYVPLTKYQTFLREYLDFVYSGARPLLTEQYHQQPYRLFFELDFNWNLPEDTVVRATSGTIPLITQAVAETWRLATPPETLVSMRTMYKVHLNFPDVITTEALARTCRSLILERFAASSATGQLPDLDWAKILDEPHGSLRLIGSAKPLRIDQDPKWVLDKAYYPVWLNRGLWVAKKLNISVLLKSSIQPSKWQLDKFVTSDVYLDAIYSAAEAAAARRERRAEQRAQERSEGEVVVSGVGIEDAAAEGGVGQSVLASKEVMVVEQKGLLICTREQSEGEVVSGIRNEDVTSVDVVGESVSELALKEVMVVEQDELLICTEKRAREASEGEVVSGISHEDATGVHVVGESISGSSSNELITHGREKLSICADQSAQEASEGEALIVVSNEDSPTGDVVIGEVVSIDGSEKAGMLEGGDAPTGDVMMGEVAPVEGSGTAGALEEGEALIGVSNQGKTTGDVKIGEVAPVEGSGTAGALEEGEALIGVSNQGKTTGDVMMGEVAPVERSGTAGALEEGDALIGVSNQGKTTGDVMMGEVAPVEGSGTAGALEGGEALTGVSKEGTAAGDGTVGGVVSIEGSETEEMLDKGETLIGVSNEGVEILPVVRSADITSGSVR